MTYCATCREFFASQGKRTVHILDLLFTRDLSRQAEKPVTSPDTSIENLKRVNAWVRTFNSEPSL